MVNMNVVNPNRAGGHIRIADAVLAVTAAGYLGLDPKTLDRYASKPWRTDGVWVGAPDGFPRAFWLGRTRFYDPAELAAYRAKART